MNRFKFEQDERCLISVRTNFYICADTYDEALEKLRKIRNDGENVL